MKKLLEKLETIFEYKAELLKKNKVEDFFFRGHSDSSWNLVPGLARIKKIKVFTENRLYCDFVNYGGHLLPQYKKDWDVLFLMQHHGIPTRLLDWTENLSVALYFAIRDSKKTKSAAIWMLDPYGLNIESCGLDGIIDLATIYPNDYTDYFVEEKDIKKDLPPIIAVNANPPNLRIVAQKGAFTLHKDLSKPLEELFPNHVKKIIIEPDLFDEVRKFLFLTGVTEFSLFPDLDGLTRYIKNIELNK